MGTDEIMMATLVVFVASAFIIDFFRRKRHIKQRMFHGYTNYREKKT